MTPGACTARHALAHPLSKDVVDWLATEIADVKAIRNSLGGTMNDVVLTTVAGAVGSFLSRSPRHARRRVPHRRAGQRAQRR
ncbi:MAG: hypothetical protein ABI629_16660 [bacterium]